MATRSSSSGLRAADPPPGFVAAAQQDVSRRHRLSPEVYEVARHWAFQHRVVSEVFMRLVSSPKGMNFLDVADLNDAVVHAASTHLASPVHRRTSNHSLNRHKSPHDDYTALVFPHLVSYPEYSVYSTC